jgi:hypothetical protein
VFQLEVQKRYRRLLIDREALPGFEIPSFRRRMSGAQSLPSLSASTYASLIPVIPILADEQELRIGKRCFLELGGVDRGESSPGERGMTNRRMESPVSGVRRKGSGTCRSAQV